MRRIPFLLPAVVAVLAMLPACNDGLEPQPVCSAGLVGVCGHVTFRGTLPDSTQALYVVAYSTFPQSTADLFNFLPFPPQPLALPAAGDSVVSYSLALPSDQYQWILAVWVKVGLNTSDTANEDSHLREAGYYRDPADTTLPGVVTVNAGATGAVDFVVDFANMHSVSYFFP